MSPFLRKFRLPAILLAGIIIISVALVMLFRKTVTLDIDGSSQEVTLYALRVSDVLRQQDIALSPQDSLTPSINAGVNSGQIITLVHAIPVQILADGKFESITSSQRVPSSLLSLAGISLNEADLLLSNGQSIDPDKAMPLDKSSISLQLVRAQNFKFKENGESHTLTSAEPTLGSALWSAGYSLYEADQLSPAAETPLSTVYSATLERSVPLTIQTQYDNVSLRSSASTIGDALISAHLTPQGLDYSLPTLAESISSDTKIRLIRVTEQVVIEQAPIPFKNEFQAVADLDLDSQSVVQPGAVGLTAQRVRVRYEDGQEAARSSDSQWVAREPQPRIIGYGTNIVMHTTTVDGVTIQYWRALTMYATSYHPSEVGDTTASGLPLKKGVVAVDTSIIPFHTQLYIPGYGQAVAADIGGGVHGRWIDLGYSDSDYVPWHSTVTVYFLWPPPANVVWVVP